MQLNDTIKYLVVSRNGPRQQFNYSSPKSGFVQLKTFDMLGKEIAILVNEEKTVGNYQIEFNGTKLSSGIYFYSLKSGKYQDVKKMLLLK